MQGLLELRRLFEGGSSYMRKYGKPSTYTIAMCQGKFWTLNVLRKTLILDGYHAVVMLFPIMQEAIKFALPCYLQIK